MATVYVLPHGPIASKEDLKPIEATLQSLAKGSFGSKTTTGSDGNVYYHYETEKPNHVLAWATRRGHVRRCQREEPK